MKILNCLLLLALVVGLAGCSSYYAAPANSFLRMGYDLSQVDQVGMVSVFGAVQSSVIRMQMEDAFTAQLLQKGYAPVVSEFLVRQLVQIQFDGADMSPKVFAIEAGRALAYTTMLIVNVTNFSDEINVTATMLDAESGSVIWIGQNSVVRKRSSSSQGAWGGSKEDTYAKEFESAMTQYNTQAYAPPGSAGVNEMLTSEEERQVYELIASICASLPLKPLGWQPSPYQQQVPPYTPPVQSYAPAPVQPAQVQVPQPVPTEVQEPVFQPAPAPQPTVQKSKTRKFRWRDLID
jgi:hypothetical protein